MIRFIPIISLALLLPLCTANAQELSGSFTANSSGETFTVESNGDGTAEIYGSDGRYVGEAGDDGDGTWDIQSPGGRNLGQIQDDSDGSFDVYGSQGGYWGSGDSD